MRAAVRATSAAARPICGGAEFSSAAPRCRFHVAQEMRPVEVRRFNYSWINEGDSARHRREKRIIWKCPIGGCHCVAATGRNETGDEADND